MKMTIIRLQLMRFYIDERRKNELENVELLPLWWTVIDAVVLCSQPVLESKINFDGHLFIARNAVQ